MKNLLLGLSLLALGSGCNQSRAAAPPPAPTVFKVAEVGLEYSLPPGWKKEKDGQLANGEDNLVVQFAPTDPAESGPAGLKAMAERLKTKFADIQFQGEPIERQSNGLHLFSLRGSGKVNNLPAEWELVLLEGGPRPFLLMEIASGAGSLEKNRAVLDQLASSFKVSEGANLPPLASATPAAAETPVPPETPLAAEETPAASETPEEE